MVVVQELFSQDVEFQWVQMCGNPPNTTDTRTILASLDDGSFFIGGEFLDTALFGTKTMVSAGGSDLFIAKCDPSGNTLWALRMGGANDEYINDIKIDEDQNIIVAGFFYGTTQIGTDEYTSLGSQDLFVAKLNPDGDFIWSYRAGGIMADYFSGIEIDNDQNIILSGYFYDQIFFNDVTLTAVAASDLFLAKINPGGELLWAFSAGGSSSDQSNSVSIDPEGSLLVTGSFYYDITLGDTTLSTLDPVGVFVAKFDGGGDLEQAFQLNGTYLNSEVLISAANTGDFYISGCFSEQVSFGDKTFNAGEFNQDLYIAKYNPDCDLQWARHAFSFGSDQVAGIDTDEFGNLYLTGHYLDTIHFELLTLNYTLCCGSREIFIVSYSTSGQVLWGRQISGTRANIKALEMAPQGKLLLSGLFTEEMTLGPFSLSHYEGFRDYFTTLETGLYTSIYQPNVPVSCSIYPNPLHDRLTVAWEGAHDRADYLICSLDGRLLAKGSVSKGGVIDVGDVPAGAFVFSLSENANHFFDRQILIKK